MADGIVAHSLGDIVGRHSFPMQRSGRGGQCSQLHYDSLYTKGIHDLTTPDVSPWIQSTQIAALMEVERKNGFDVIIIPITIHHNILHSKLCTPLVF